MSVSETLVDTGAVPARAERTRGEKPARRKTRGGGMAVAVALSLAVHAGIAAYVITTQFVLKVPEVETTDAILVSMGPLDLPKPEKNTPPPPPPPPESRPMIQPRETPAPIIQQVAPLPVAPVKSEAPLAPRSDAPPEISKAAPAPAATAPRNEFVGVDVDLAMSSNPPPAYPPQAKARREEGTVVLRLEVRGDGSVGEVQVSRSSGSMRLDRAAADAVKRWKFKPATQAGKPVESWATVPITFGFKKGDRRRGRHGHDRDDNRNFKGDDQ